MNHKDWIQKELRKLGISLGFKYVPFEEIEDRLTRVRNGMKKQEIEALLVIQKMDFYYLSGTTQDGILFVPLEGKPLLMIRRELERAKVESPIENVVALDSNRVLPSLIKDYSGNLLHSLGLELDVLPVKDYFRLQDLFPGTRLMDASLILRDARKIKTPYEIQLMRVA